MLPASKGVWARQAPGRAARARGMYAPSEFAPTRWATPPYRGHKGKFAPCETPPGWIGLVLKLDSPYIYIGGVSHHHPPSIIICSPARTSAGTHYTERAKLVTRPTKTGLWPATPRQNLTTHSAGVQRPLVIGLLLFLFTLIRSTKRHARRVLASHRREETVAPTHGAAFGSCRTPSVWGRVEG